jgi:hypothetical protein
VIDEGDRPEMRGQFLYDLNLGRLLPRPVVRSSAIADRTQPVPSIMTAFPAGVQTPLSPLGSKLQTLWRYHDVGYSLLDESNHNIDVEGLAWSPTTGTVNPDFYTEFEVRLSHTRFLPDEDINPTSLFPLYPASGLKKAYADNLLAGDSQQLVHHRSLGYDVNQQSVFPSDSGTLMMPYPMNLGKPLAEFEFYTWRDTSVLTLGAPNGVGADTSILATVDGVSTSSDPYAKDMVPTIGLPLLMEFRCFPEEEGLGQNSFDISLAVNSSALPGFRAFSTGGVNASGTTVFKNPDDQTEATGGFSGSSTPPGQSTRGVDNSFYIGQADIVVRVSRMHSMWFPALDTKGEALSNPKFVKPIVEPRPEDLPLGTDVIFAYRGALQVSGGAVNGADSLDFYGDPRAPGPDDDFEVTMLTPFDLDNDWNAAITAIDGAAFMQFRVTFISNGETQLTAELSALGFAFHE